MVSMTPVEILTELRESGDYENAVLGTYAFSPTFFENQILPKLRSKDVQNIVVLIDPIDLEATFKEAKEVGIFYLLEPMATRNIFHPKFTLLTSTESGKLTIGSANITQQGYASNGEILTSLDYDKYNPSTEALSVFIGMKEFLQRSIEKGLVRSSKHAAKIHQAINVPWLKSEPKCDRIRLIHSLDMPILEQIRMIVEGQEIERIIISSFLFSSEVIRYICEKFCKKVDIILQPGRAIGLARKEIENIIKDTGATLSFHQIVFKDEESRFLHAKVFLMKGNKGSYCLTGSANPTVSAMLSTPPTGNVEVCLLRFEEDKEYFDYLFDNPSITVKKIDLDRIAFVSSPPLPPVEKSDLDLIEARIEGNCLIVEFLPLNPNYKLARLIIRRANAIEPKIIDTETVTDDKIAVRLSEDAQRYCQDSCFVVLELRRERDDPNPLVSNKRWISTEISELVPSNRDVETVRRTDGRVGLIKLLNQLDKASESPQMLLYYLQFIDFDWLFETVKSVRKHIVETIDPEIMEDQRYMLERLNITPEYVLNKILTRHQRKFKELTSHVEPTPDLTVKVEKIFNLSMFINKMVIWFVLNKKCSVSELIHICGYDGTIDIFCNKFLDKLRRLLGKEEADNLMDSLNVLTHIMVLSKIIRDIQHSDPIYERVNLWPIRRFNELYRKSLENLCENSEEIIAKGRSKLPKLIKEYEEFQGISLGADDVLANVAVIFQS